MSLSSSVMIETQPRPERIRALVVNHSASAAADISAVLERDTRVDVVGTAKDGIVALRTARAHAPDLIVIDVSTACLSGFEAAGWLRDGLPGAKIIVVCSEADQPLPSIADRFGADALLPSSTLDTECAEHLLRLFPAKHHPSLRLGDRALGRDGRIPQS